MLIPGFLFVLYRKNKERCIYSILVWRPNLLRKESLRGFPGVRWLRLPTPNIGGLGSIPDQGTEILHAAECGQNK